MNVSSKFLFCFILCIFMFLQIPAVAQNSRGIFGPFPAETNEPGQRPVEPPPVQEENNLPPTEMAEKQKTEPIRSDGERSGSAGIKNDNRQSVIQIPETGEIELNFEDADLGEVILTLSEILNINYLMDPGIKGKVTIRTAGTLQKKELFPVFFQILEVNGLTAVKEGSLYKIIPFKDSARNPIVSRYGRSFQDGPEGKVVVQIIPLKYIEGEEMTKVLTPFVSSQGTIVSHANSSTLLVADTLINIEKVLKLVSAFDINLFDRLEHRFFPLEYANAEEVAQTIGEMIGFSGEETRNNLAILPIQRLNTLLILGTTEQSIRKVEGIARQLDLPPQDTEPQINIYFVKNGQARELSELLNQVFSGQPTRKSPTAESSPQRNPYAIPAGKGDTGEKDAAAAKPVEGMTINARESPTLGGKVNITPDEIRNAIIIEATPKDYRIIGKILDSLDVLPRQVLIEVTIAEISVKTSLELGVEWEYVKGSGNLSTSLLNANIGSAGLQYLIGNADRWSAALSALARDDKVNILSSPTVLASDNKEAKIDISTEIPVASAQYQYTGETEPLLQTNIQYRNTGVILTVTPHINEFGLVSMDISQEVSELSESVQVGGENLPSFFKRSVDTSLTVRHGQTIVIGGLIRENRSRGRSGVPCIGGLPLLEWAFGKKTDTNNKTELILLITPRVISTLEDIDAVSNEFAERIGHVLKEVDARP